MSELLNYIILGNDIILEDIKTLLDRGVDVNYINNDGESILHLCMDIVHPLDGFFWDRESPQPDEDKYAWQLNFIKLLIKYGADVNIQNSFGRSVLSSYLYHKVKLGFIEILLNSNADINSLDKAGNTPLHHYAYYQNEIRGDLLKRMMKHSNINVQNKDGYTPLLSFISNGCPAEHIQTLLQGWADVRPVTKHKMSVLHMYAVSFNNFSEESSSEVLRLLLDKGADTFCLNDKNWTPLIEFISERVPYEPLAILLSYVANNHRPFMCLNSPDYGDCLELLNKKSTDSEDEDQFPVLSRIAKSHVNNMDGGITALHRLIMWRDEDDADGDILRLLIKYGANVNLKTDAGLTPLHLIMHNFPHEDTINILLEGGADVNLKDPNGNTALHLYVSQYYRKYETAFLKHKINLNILESIIEKHNDINVKDKDGDSPLIVYFEQCQIEFSHIKALLNAGADVNSTTRGGQSPIHLLAKHCKVDKDLALEVSSDCPTLPDIDSKLNILKLLIERGADLNLRSISGMTPLMNFLANHCNVEFIEILLSHGADLTARDYTGRTVLHYHATYKTANWLRTGFTESINFVQVSDNEVLKLLLDYGCDPNLIPFNRYIADRMHINCIKMLFNYGARFVHNSVTDVMCHTMINIYDLGKHNDYFKALKYMVLDGNLYKAIKNEIFTVSHRCDFIKYTRTLQDEIINMKFRYLDNAKKEVPIHTFLMETNLCKLGSYYMQYKISLADLATEFPTYIDVIESKIEIARYWAGIIKTVRCLNITTRGSSDREVTLNSDCVWQISQFLESHDLLKLERASKLCSRELGPENSFYL